MTTEQYWANLDALASSKGTDRLLDAAELLRTNPSLPLSSSPAATFMGVSGICSDRLMRGIRMQTAIAT